MTQDSDNNNPEPKESTAPSPEPFQPSEAGNPPTLQATAATYEALVKFKEAILTNEHWRGSEAQCVAIGLQIIINMESQYRVQVERMRADAKESVKRARQEINRVGGRVNAPSETVN